MNFNFATPPPPHQPATLDTIRVFGGLSLSDTSSPSTDVEMQDADWASNSGDDEMRGESPCLPSIEVDHAPSLRGGILHHPPPHLSWARKAAIESRKLSKIKEEEDLPEDDANSTSSDWDSYGDCALTVDEYDEMVGRLEGSEDWNADQKKLHKQIHMLGLHPVMPSWWRMSFKMWGVTQPHLDDLFTPKNSKKRVAINAYGNEVAGKHASAHQAQDSPRD